MGLDLVDYDLRAREAVKAFWGNRDIARKKNLEAGKTDQGERGSVTAGKNMDGFLTLLLEIIRSNGLDDAGIYTKRALLTLPGYFRPTKLWDLLVTCKGELVAAIELKSQVGSFGNNCNNRAEEAIGTAHDFWTAYREEAFGKQPRPFVGWLMMVEDCMESRRPITRDSSPHFPIFPEFKGASYLQRYDLLCQRLVQEQLYTTASVLASRREGIETGDYLEMSNMTNLKTFVTALAGHVAAQAERLR